MLKPTGSLCVHCDWHADAYIRTHILDKLGGGIFVNNIVWSYQRWTAGKFAFQRTHDTIFIYSRSKKYTFNVLTESYSENSAHKAKRFTKIENGKLIQTYTDDTIREKSMRDVWEISILNPQSKERVGYPTQKPLALINRIIKSLSNEGDIVLDAFCGGGTTLLSAAQNNRRFIGIDCSAQSFAVSRARLENDLFRPSFSVETPKYDYDAIRNTLPFEFERFMVERYGGESHAKQIGDFGIDGLLHEGQLTFPIQVKRSDKIGRNVVDNFKSAMTRFNKDCKRGHIIAFSFGSGAIEEVARLKREEGIDITLASVGSIIPIAMPPHISLTFDWREVDDKNGDKEVSFIAAGADIELWQWDWNYSTDKGFAPEVLRDREGKQTRVFSTGSYEIAVRGVDKDGISAIETLKLIVNGGVRKEEK